MTCAWGISPGWLGGIVAGEPPFPRIGGCNAAMQYYRYIVNRLQRRNVVTMLQCSILIRPSTPN
jgi:hypothetical protein